MYIMIVVTDMSRVYQIPILVSHIAIDHTGLIMHMVQHCISLHGLIHVALLVLCFESNGQAGVRFIFAYGQSIVVGHWQILHACIVDVHIALIADILYMEATI